MKNKTYLISLLLFTVFVTLLAGCKNADSPTEPTEEKSSIKAISGDEQSGVVATELAQALIVKVSKSNGEPVSGTNVNWLVKTGEGSISSSSTTTDDQGKTQVQWTLGIIAGKQSVEAKISEAGSTATFGAVAEADEPTQFIVKPESFTLQTWGDSLQVSASIADQYGNPVDSEPVTWSSSNSEVVSMDENGWARSYWAARPGEAVLTADAAGYTAQVNAEVKAQMNPNCKEPTDFPVQGAVAGIPTFASEYIVEATPPPYYDNKAAVGDFDGDGDEDIMVFSYNVPWDNTGNKDGEVLFWENDGTGQFSDATAVVLEPDFIKAEHTADVETAEFNGDGILDIFIPQSGYDQDPFPGAPNRLFLSNGDGTITEEAPTNLSPHETTGYTHSSASGDVDCDGDIDIYEGDLFNGEGPHLQINNGSGSFVAEDDRLPPKIASSELAYTDSEFLDVDRDGDLDLMLGEIGGSGDVLLINDGFGYFSRSPAKTLPEPYFTVDNVSVRLRAGDLNLDGWPDLLVSQTPEYNDKRLALWLNNGDGTFTDDTADRLPQPWESWTAQLNIVDLNKDGWPDLLIDRYMLINQGGTFFDATGSVEGLYLNEPEKRDYSTYLTFPIDADGDNSQDILIVRGWYLFEEGEVTPAVILRNTN
ncbi:MAG: VCBS repeat-containing protein [Gracilimonas sp.]|uniref:FG-GAP-like repeat-containing protein n=1 Tax=Gracilimonas sp. TaxID=1974203 RepID=UPI00198A648A|nr:FG-GAP-like repeat-containing protein [Gracilimonas sp.]MBD3616900.1 VCBS repeat-containing protein [Gracilimonas sp.]